MNNTNRNRTRNVLSLLAGAAIGGGFVYLMYTKNGKKFRKRVVKRVGEINTQVKDQVTHGYEVAQQRVSEAIDASKNFVNETRHNLTDRLEHFAENFQNKMDEVEDRIEEGAKMAKKKIKETKNGVEV